MSLNKVMLIGNVGRDPELRRTPKGNAVLNISVSTHHPGKDENGEPKEETQWHKATLWGKLAETCAKHLVKGSRVYLDGELQEKSYTDKEGVRRKSTEIYVDTLRFLGGMRRDPAGPMLEAVPPPQEAPAEI